MPSRGSASEDGVPVTAGAVRVPFSRLALRPYSLRCLNLFNTYRYHVFQTATCDLQSQKPKGLYSARIRSIPTIIIRIPNEAQKFGALGVQSSGITSHIQGHRELTVSRSCGSTSSVASPSCPEPHLSRVFKLTPGLVMLRCRAREHSRWPCAERLRGLSGGHCRRHRL